jgi:hypothetical protein
VLLLPLPCYNAARREIPVERLDLNQCIVTIPDKEVAPAVVLYGGKMGWQGEWFLAHKKIPSNLLQNVYLIMPTSYTNSCKECLREFRANIKPANVTRYSICGFSRGAQEVYRYRDLEQWKLFGLIDPSSPTLDIFQDDVLDHFADKIRCVYWVPNWGKTGYDGRIPRFAQHLRDLKVAIIEKEVYHGNMPTFFFEQFGIEFLS